MIPSSLTVDILLLLSLFVVASIGQQSQPKLTQTQHDALTALLQFPTALQVAASVDYACVVNSNSTTSRPEAIADIMCVLSGKNIVAGHVVLNGFEGLINGTALSALSSSLTHLEISATSAVFKGVPTELGLLKMLTSLALRGFDDAGATPSVLAIIKSLSIQSVEISGSFSAQLSDLPPRVERVVLDSPLVSGTLAELSKLTTLTALTLNSNSVQGDLLDLTSLPLLSLLTISSQSVTNKAFATFGASCTIASCIRNCPTTCVCTIAAGCELLDTLSPTSAELSPAPTPTSAELSPAPTPMAPTIGGPTLTTVPLFEPPRQEEPLIGVFVGVALGVIGLLMFVIGSVVMFRDRTEPQPSPEAAPAKPPRALIKRVSSRSRLKGASANSVAVTEEDGHYVELALQPGGF
jgi:hypothetical protein